MNLNNGGGLWVLQKKNPESGLWASTKTFKSKEEALKVLNRKKTTSPLWRVVSKPEADKYREGVKAGLRLVRPNNVIRPLLALPDNL